MIQFPYFLGYFLSKHLPCSKKCPFIENKVFTMQVTSGSFPCNDNKQIPLNEIKICDAFNVTCHKLLWFFLLSFCALCEPRKCWAFQPLRQLNKKWSFPLRISSVTKSEVFCGFGHIYWRNFLWKTSFLCSGLTFQWRI